MAAAARDYLAIPASEVAVERVFSTARDVLGIRRTFFERGYHKNANVDSRWV